MNKNLIIPHDKYPTDKPVPYVYQVNKSDRILVFFGAKHSFDVADTQFKLLKEKWLEFLTVTNRKNCLVFYEAKLPNINLTREEEIINKFGEAGLIRYLAEKNNIESLSPEPPPELEIRELLKKYDAKLLSFFYFLRSLSSLLKNKKGNQFWVKADGLLEKRKWPDTDFSLDNTKTLFKEIFNKELDPIYEGTIINAVNPTRKDSVVNEIARESSSIRNEYVLKKIEEYWAQDKNLFIVYGVGHAIVLEPAIRQLSE